MLEVLRSGVLSMGPWTERFEAALAGRIGTKHAIACSSGTAGLHLLLAACGIGEGDEVITPSFSFVATANAIRYTGARPVFAEIDPETLCMDPADVEARITDRTRALLPVDMFGHPADLPALRSIADRHRLLLLEDACEALGAAWEGVPCGHRRFADGAVFAFYPNKQITTGEGGMIVTDDDRMASLCRSLRNQGRDEQSNWLNHIRLGYNYRMDEMSAAVGAVQMTRLDEILAAREAVAQAYTQRLASVLGVRTPVVKRGARMSWFVYTVMLAPDVNRDGVMAALLSQGIGCRPYFPAIHLQGCSQGDPTCRPGALPLTEEAARRTLALPFHNRLQEAEIDEVVAALAEAVAKHR